MQAPLSGLKYFKQKTPMGDCLETIRSHVQILPFLSLQRPKDPLHFHPSGPKRFELHWKLTIVFWLDWNSLFFWPPASFWQCPQLLLWSHLSLFASVTCKENQFMISLGWKIEILVNKAAERSGGTIPDQFCLFLPLIIELLKLHDHGLLVKLRGR